MSDMAKVLLKAFQSNLARSRYQCDEDEIITWDEIDLAVTEIMEQSAEIARYREALTLIRVVAKAAPQDPLILKTAEDTLLTSW
tara:strand:- start:5201 stop:5452 length:252 start_codon:yes stop_codon:yes gene_type:complete